MNFYRPLLVAWFLLATPTGHAGWIWMGDQHSMGRFGVELEAQLRKNLDPRGRMVAACGMSFTMALRGGDASCGWAQSSFENVRTQGTRGTLPKLRELTEEARSKGISVDWVLFQLGQAQLQQTQAQIENDVKVVLQELDRDGAMCIVLTPPHQRANPQAVERWTSALERAAQSFPCAVLDSTWFQDVRYPARGGDGIFFDSLGVQGGAISQRWAKQVFDTLKELLDIEFSTREDR